MNIIRPLLIIGLILSAVSTQALAETRYVSDVLVVTVRDQKGNNYKAIDSLVSNSPVEILEEDKRYVKVRTAKGVEGYILKQYITKKTPKTVQIKRLQTNIANLEQTLEKITANSESSGAAIAQKTAEVNQLQQQLTQARNSLKTVSSEYEALKKDSDNVLTIKNENEQMREENQKINSELLVLREENQNFHRTNMIQWFLAGGGVFFGGWLVGKISRKKQRGYSRL